MPHFTLFQWFLAIVGAMGIGVAKSGFSGVSLLHVLIFASLFTAKDSTGVVLPMLIVGDVFAVLIFRRHARWEYVRRLLPPTALGVMIGAFFFHMISEAQFKPVIGAVILSLTALQLLRLFRPQLFEHVPHRLWFAWTMGLATGITTMLANAAGPITALYLLAVALPKFELVGTSAWLFFVVNCFKVPFSAANGVIHADTLLLNAALIPAIVCGLFAGRWLVARIPQRLFDTFLLIFAGFAAARMLGVFQLFTRF
jgi:uncharacterized membrane protein YfcA